jgi:regulator of sigma E protease
MTGVPTLLPIVGEISAGLPAASAGLKPGDKILAMDSKPVDEWGNFAGSIRNGGGKPIRLEFERLAGATPTRMTVTITPTKITQKAPFGGQSTTWVMGVKPRGDVITRRFGIARSGREAIRTSWTMTVELVDGIYGIIAGSTPVKEALGGPIMIAQIAGREAHQGFASLAMFTVMLSLELGLINLLPVPLLDGGHLLFFFFEGAMGRPLELRYREVMLQVGLSLLVALMAFVIFNDIARLVQG